MEDKASVIFGNPIDKKTIRKGIASKKKYLKKFGDDSAGSLIILPPKKSLV
jgi:hypothetical protein